MPKVALNARFYAHRPTGMQRYAIELAERLSDDLHVIRPRKPLKGASGHLWEQIYLPVACGKRLLWSPNNTGPISVRNQVCTIHDLIPLEHPEWFNPRFAAWYRWLFPRLAARLQHAIAISEFTKSRVVELLNIPADRITVIPNGVDSRFCPASPEAIAKVRARFAIPGPYLLSVSSIEPRKNIARLLQAWEQVARQFPDLTLVLAGAKGASLVFAGVEIERLPERVLQTGYVPQESLPTLYSGAEAFIYPSLYEGFGLPPLEAMACGTPVVTSDNTSLPEVARGAAVLVDAFATESIAAGMRSILEDSDLRKKLREEGLRRAGSLTWDRTAERTRAVLMTQAN